MNKAELVEAVAKDTDDTKAAAQRAVESVVANIVKGAKKGSVSLVGFGTFKVVRRKARNGLNPQTQKKIRIPAKNVLKFKASHTLKL